MARLTFVEREAINERLVNSLMTRGKQVVVFGPTGGGKTTLIVNKLTQLYENHFTTRCMSTTTFDQLVLDAFDQLEPFYKHSVSEADETGRTGSLATTYAGIKAKISSKKGTSTTEEKRRVLPPQLTPENLARLIGATEACWVIEDFHKVTAAERRRLAQLMKVFVDSADEYAQLRIIAIGAVGAAGDVVSLEPEMWTRVAEIPVDLMAPRELTEIITEGSRLLNLEFPDPVRNGIVHFSSGLPSVCHQLCLNLCHNAGIVETIDSPHKFSAEELDKAVWQWLEEAAEPLASAYRGAIDARRTAKFDNCRLIVDTLALFDRGATHEELLGAIRTREPSYPAGNLTRYLEELSSERREYFLISDNSSKYIFSSPMVHAYVRARVWNRTSTLGSVAERFARHLPGKPLRLTHEAAKTRFLGPREDTFGTVEEVNARLRDVARSWGYDLEIVERDERTKD